MKDCLLLALAAQIPYGVRPSIPSAKACGGFAAVGPTHRRYRSIAARPATQQLNGNVFSIAYFSGAARIL